MRGRPSQVTLPKGTGGTSLAPAAIISVLNAAYLAASLFFPGRRPIANSMASRHRIRAPGRGHSPEKGPLRGSESERDRDRFALRRCATAMDSDSASVPART